MKRKPITRREMETAYRLCLERERDRDRKTKLTKQGAFEASFVHFDLQQAEASEREMTSSWLSDRGKGARQIRRACDLRPDPAKERQRCIDRAKHLVARKAPECLRVFWLVIKNGKNREESIWELMKDRALQPNKFARRKQPSIGTR